jgi:hypothetical protein
MELRIFAARPPVIRPPRTEPSPRIATTPRPRIAGLVHAAPAAATTPVAPPLPVATTPVALARARDEFGEAALSILLSTSAWGESVAVAYARIERELGALFASLAPDAARTLHARLTNVDEGDAFATRFARMVTERRARLLAILADAPRRATLKAQL